MFTYESKQCMDPNESDDQKKKNRDEVTVFLDLDGGTAPNMLQQPG